MKSRIVTTGIRELAPMVRGGEPGNHVSAIIRDLCIQLGHFDDDEVDGPLDADALSRRQTRWELGSAFERCVIDALKLRTLEHQPDRYISPGELEVDGLLGNMDLYDLIDDAVLEMKLTWLSSKHDIESVKFWKYLVQIKAYCYMAKTRRGYLHVCHVMGDYRENQSPLYNVHECLFDQRELIENWRMLLTHRDAMVKNGVVSR